MLEEVAKHAGAGLLKVRVQGAPSVTDAGLGALVSHLPKVQSLVIDDICRAPNNGERSWLRPCPCRRVTARHVVSTHTPLRLLTSLVRTFTTHPFTGSFLVKLFQGCPDLETLHVVGVPYMNWQQCRAASEGWSNPRLTKLVVRTSALDVEFGTIIGRLPNLAELELDGPARNIKAAALGW